MRVLLFRLHMCWLCLTSRRAVLSCPRYRSPKENEVRVLGSNMLSAYDWASIVEMAAQRHNKAMQAAESRLLAEVQAAEDEYQQQLLIEQARGLVS